MELFLLSGEGIDAFPADRRAAALSFLIPLCLVPVALRIAALFPPRGFLEQVDPAHVGIIAVMRYAMAIGLHVLYAWLIALAFRRRAALAPYFEAGNWAGLVLAAIAMPVALAAYWGWLPLVQADRILVMIDLYGYIVLGLIAHRTFRLNWQLAGFIACVAILAGQHAWQVVYAVWGLQVPWVY